MRDASGRAAALARALGDGWDPEDAGTLAAAGGDAGGAGAGPGSPRPTREAVWAALEGVPDPEIPVVSVVELGIVREVDVSGGAVTVVITPTYSGCPAMREIEREVAAALHARGWRDVTVRTVHAPAWTTDWIGPAAREKLRAYGIAPPGAAGGGPVLVPLARRGRGAPEAPTVVIACPRCGSADTVVRSAFGSTACKTMHACRACGEPFEAFRAV